MADNAQEGIEAPEGIPAEAAVVTERFIPTNLPFPQKLDFRGNIANNWKRFQRMWTNYEIATGLVHKDKATRTATFLTCIGPDALEIFDGFVFNNEEEDESQDIDIVIAKFENFCVGKTNETYERYCFNKRDQEQGENIDTYVATLRTLVKTCNYGVIEESLIRDRIVIGIRDNNTRKKLLQDSKLTLNSCIDICRANEKTVMQMKDISHEDVQLIKRKDKPRKTFVPKQQAPQVDCKFCGRKHRQNREACPAWGKTCDLCGKENHFRAKCGDRKSKFSKRKPKIGKSRKSLNCIDQSSSEDEEYMFTMEDVNSMEPEKKIFAVMKIQNQLVKFLVDCGSTANVLSTTVYKKLFHDEGLTQLEPTRTTLVMYNESQMAPIGQRKVTVINPKNRKWYSTNFVVVKGNAQPILGSIDSQRMKLIKVNKHNIQSESVNKIDQSTSSTSNQQAFQSKYPDVFKGDGKLSGKLRLDVDRSVVPVKLATRKVPVSIKDKVKDHIDNLCERDILVPVDVPTDWISSMVVVTKPSGNIRLCIDPKPLNIALKRNHYPSPLIDDLLPDLENAKLFTVADAKNGFWHVELEEESSFLTTFGTPWGRYRWKRMPFGISPAPEEFQRRMDEALEGLKGVRAIHDDILIYGCGKDDKEAEIDHDKNLTGLIERCREKGIKLNRDKLKFKLKEVTYMGHKITSEGLKIDPEKVKAVTDMPIPKDRQAVQRLLGMVNYVQKFAPCLSEMTSPLRQLLKNENEFHWDPQVHGLALERIKKSLSSTPVLRFFDKNKSTVLQSDASQTGLGACLLQEGQPICYASRSLTVTEENYAQIEKEMLAIVFGMEKFDNYTYGRKILVESDHKPLEIICKKSLMSAPKRLQRMLLRLQKYDFEIMYKAGSEMYMADTLSRAYLTTNSRSEIEKDLEHVNVIKHLPISTETVENLIQATKEDDDMQELKRTIQLGWPDKKDQIDNAIQKYYPFREELTFQKGLILKGDRIVIPKRMRNEMVKRAHSSHIGIQGCLRRARECLYWPNMNDDIQSYIQSCESCNTYNSEQQKETLRSHEITSRPWQKIACDLFEFNQQDFLLTVDYYSDYFEVDRLSNKKGKEVIKKLKIHFSRYGLPDELFSDNGPPFNSSEFQEFSKSYEFRHTTSSPGYPQSNGKVENSVKTAKRLMRKAQRDGTDPYLALLDWRNTPTEGLDSSPAQRMFGKRCRTLLPTSDRLLKPKLPQKVVRNKTIQKKKQQKYYNRNAKDKFELTPGDVVRIKPKEHNREWTKAKVEKQVNIRSYKVVTEDGREFRRNRKHLRQTQETMNDDTDPITTEVENQETNSDNKLNEQNVKPTTPSDNVRKSERVRRKPKYLQDYVC